MRLVALVGIFIVAAAAFAIEVGDQAPPLNRPEVVTANGGYGPNVNIDTLTGAGKTVFVSFGYDT